MYRTFFIRILMVPHFSLGFPLYPTFFIRIPIVPHIFQSEALSLLLSSRKRKASQLCSQPASGAEDFRQRAVRPRAGSAGIQHRRTPYKASMLSRVFDTMLHKCEIMFACVCGERVRSISSTSDSSSCVIAPAGGLCTACRRQPTTNNQPSKCVRSL